MSLELQKKWYTEGYMLVQQAISLEETITEGSISSNKQREALNLYTKGIELLDKTNSLKFEPSDWDVAGAFQSKIWRTIQMTKHRMWELSNIISATNVTAQSNAGPPSPQQPSTLQLGANLASVLKGLNLGNYSEQGMTRSDEVNAHRNAAEGMLNQIKQNPWMGNETSSHFGPPKNLSEVADLLLEGSLLPKPGGGLANRNRFGANNNNATNNNNNNNVSPFFPPPSQQYRDSGAKFSIGAFKKTEFFLKTLESELQQNWKKINFIEDIDEALFMAQQQRKPIFIEIVVGRMGDKTTEVC